MPKATTERVKCRYCKTEYGKNGIVPHENACAKNPNRRPHTRSAEFAVWARANGRRYAADIVDLAVAEVVKVGKRVSPADIAGRLPDEDPKQVARAMLIAANAGKIEHVDKGAYGPVRKARRARVVREQGDGRPATPVVVKPPTVTTVADMRRSVVNDGRIADAMSLLLDVPVERARAVIEWIDLTREMMNGS